MLSKRANIDFCKNKMLDSPMPLTCFSHQKKKLLTTSLLCARPDVGSFF